MCGMKAQRQAPGGEAAMATQPMSHHALPGGIAGERLTNGVRCSSLAGMDRQADTQIKRRHNCLDWRFRGSVCAASRLEGFEQSTEGLNSEGFANFLTGSADLPPSLFLSGLAGRVLVFG